jgi:hypothetical protein
VTTQTRTQGRRNGNGPEGPDTGSMEYKVDCLIWLLCEEQLRTVRLAQALASLLVQAAQPQITAGIVGQLLSTGTPIQGAPPVQPNATMPPRA